MKRLLTFLVVLVCTVVAESQAAVNIKKAAPVAAKKADATESATSLLPAVIGLVGNVKNLQAQQQQLTADCAPTSDEIRTVNDLVKEWAKISETNSFDAASGLGDRSCDGSYQTFLDLYDEACYETFSSSADEGTVWEDFPKVSSGKKCKDDAGKKCETVSNIYDIFVKIPFTDEDYTKAEARKIAELKEKAQRCAPAKVAAAKRELYGGFVTQALSSIGQTTGTAGTSSVLETVSSMGGSGDVKSMLPSLGSMATQLFDK